MKIREIQIKNFRAFRGNPFTVNLHNGENLIVFGENGSGKSSFFYAIKDFFASIPKSLDISSHPYKNFFAKTTDDVSVKIKFLQPEDIANDGTTSTTTTRKLKLNYEWSNRINDSSDLAKQGLDVTKGFIDYKNLLETYFLQKNNDTVNIFDFLLEDVLTDVKVLDGSQTFGELWNAIIDTQNHILSVQSFIDKAKDKRTVRLEKMEVRYYENVIDEKIELLNSHLIKLLPQLSQHANDILRAFDMNISIEMDYALARYDKTDIDKRNAIKAKDITLHVNFYDKRRGLHHRFLNEARLSAIAISLYFASFLVNPQAGIKILVLDDLLIGLDMANRLPVLEILDEYFSAFQIFIFTFDKFWYQALQYRFPSWETIEFYSLKKERSESPMVKRPQSFMEKAQEQIRYNNYESAANFLRSYYEEIIKDFCAHCRLKVPFQSELKKLNAKEFWQAICDKDNPYKPSASIQSRIVTVVKTILNPLSHAGNPPMTRDEIMCAKRIVEELSTELRALKAEYDRRADKTD